MPLLPLIMLAGILAPAAAPQQTVSQTALAVRGGVLMIPIQRSSADTLQTTSVAIVNDGQRTDLTGEVIAIGAELRKTRHWSWPSTRPVTTSKPDSQTRTWLAVTLPKDGRGNLEWNGRTIDLRWSDLQDGMPPLCLGHPPAIPPNIVDITPLLASPPLDDPLQAWRWELLAARHGVSPPDLSRFHGGDLLLATHDVQQWRQAMWRLHTASPSVARTAADLFTASVTMQGHTVAGWLTEPAARTEFLAAMQTGSDDLAEAALAWCDRQVPVGGWVSKVHGPSIEVSLLNASPAQELIELAWNRAGELPIASVLAARSGRVVQLPPLNSHARDALVIEVGTNQMMLPVDRQTQRVEPPGPTLGPLSAAWTLGDVRLATPPKLLPVNELTFVQLRRLAGHWELMFECRWTHPVSTGSWADWSLDTLPQHEAVLIHVVEQNRTHHMLITPDGHIAAAQGDTIPKVSTRSHPHAWLARVSIPDLWTDAGELSLAIARGHANTDGIETWPTPCASWDLHLDPAPFDLRDWDQQFSTGQQPR